jgi:ERF superfamily
MKTSESQANLAKALFLAWGKFPAIEKKKDGQAGHRQFKYAPFDAILDAVKPVLIECGLMLTQGTDGHNLVTRLDHPASGEWRETMMPMNAEHANMQSYGIEMTYRRRYAAVAMLGIVTEDDTDGLGGRDKKKGTNFTNDGPPSGSARSTMKDSLEALQPEIQRAMRTTAEHMTKAMPRAGDALSIFDIAAGNWPDEDKNELKKAVWYLLDSKTRSAIKAHEAAQ